MDLDQLLGLEDQFYNEGYNEGKSEIITETLRSGKMLGIQTGFQRLLLIGMIIGYLKAIQQQAENPEFKRFKGKLRLQDIEIDELLKNDDSSIIKLDKLIKKSRNWLQMNGNSKREDNFIPKISVVDEIILSITGQTTSLQNTNLEDW